MASAAPISLTFSFHSYHDMLAWHLYEKVSARCHIGPILTTVNSFVHEWHESWPPQCGHSSSQDSKRFFLLRISPSLVISLGVVVTSSSQRPSLFFAKPDAASMLFSAASSRTFIVGLIYFFMLVYFFSPTLPSPKWGGCWSLCQSAGLLLLIVYPCNHPLPILGRVRGEAVYFTITFLPLTITTPL